MARGGARFAPKSAGPVDGLWEIPDAWVWRRARDFAQIVGGGTPKNAANPDNYDPNGTPWITPADLSGYKRSTISRGARSLSGIGVAGSSARVLPKGAVLVSSRAPVGYCTVADNPVATNQGFKSLMLSEGVDPFFIRYYVLYSKNYLESCASGTTFKELSGAAMGELVFPIPPLGKQKEIVARIDELFSEIDDGERELAEAREGLNAYRASLLNAAVTGKLTAEWRRDNPSTETGVDLLRRILADRRARWGADPRNRRKHYADPVAPDTSDAFELPDGWNWASLDQLSWSSQYGTSAKCTPDGRGQPVLRIPNLNSGSIDRANMKFANERLGLSSSDFIAPGDLLIVRTNGSEDLIGRTGIAITDSEADTYFASYLIRFRLVGQPSLWRWIQAFTESGVFRELVKLSIGSSAGQYNLSMGKLSSFPIALPPRAEIEKILERCAEAAMPQSIEIDAASLRQSILSAAFRGELV